MAAKTVIVNDVVMETIFLHPLEGGLLPAFANYSLTGDDPALLNAAGTFVTTRSPEWATLPQNIQDAIITIRDYMYNAALEDQGMNT